MVIHYWSVGKLDKIGVCQPLRFYHLTVNFAWFYSQMKRNASSSTYMAANISILCIDSLRSPMQLDLKRSKCDLNNDPGYVTIPFSSFQNNLLFL